MIIEGRDRLPAELRSASRLLFFADYTGGLVEKQKRMERRRAVILLRWLPLLAARIESETATNIRI